MPSLNKISSLILILFLIVGFTLPSQVQAQDKPSTTNKDSLDIYDEIIMDRITVIGKPDWLKNIPGSASIIDFQELEKQSYSDVNRVLRKVPGVYIQEEDGFGLRPNIGLRGTGVERSSKITLMEDGVLIAPAPYAAPAAYYFPTVGRMSGIEVRKGSSQIKYGPNTNGGAINFRSTQIPYELSGMADVSFGEYSSRKLHAYVGNTHENVGYLVETYQMVNDGFKNLDTGNDTGFDTKDFLGKLMFRTDGDANIYQKVEFKFGYYDEISNETYLGLTDADFQETPFRRYAGSQVDQMDADHTQLQMRHFALFSEMLDLTTTVYRNDFNRNWYKLDQVDGVGISSLLESPQQNQAAYDIVRGFADSGDDALSVKANNREYYSQGIQTVLNYQFSLAGGESELQIGARYHQDEMDRFQWVDGYRMEDAVMIRTSEGEPGTESNRIESANALALFIQDKITVGNWIFTPGIRYEHVEMKRENFGSNDPERTGTDLSINETTLDVFVPGLGASYGLTEAVTIFGGIHKGFTPPSPGASDDSNAELSVNYELGTRFGTEAVQVEVVGFFNDYSNLLGTDLAAGGGGGTTAQFNAGEVDVYGAEVSMAYDLAGTQRNFSLPLSVNYTFTKAEFKNSFESDYGAWGTVNAGDELPYLPEHQFNGSLGLDSGAFSVNFNAYTTSAMRTVAGSEDLSPANSTDSYFLLDATTSYQVNDLARVFINARNLTDATYIVSRRPAGVRPGLPRTFMGGLKLTF